MPGLVSEEAALDMDPGTDFGLPSTDLEFTPAGPFNINDTGREERDIYFVLCGSRDDLSCVNKECAPWLESVSLENQTCLGIPDSNAGEELAILRFKTSRCGSISIYLR